MCDGVDTVAWTRAQPWSDGRVAMVGASYSGCVQFQVAARRPEGLVAIAPALSGTLRTVWYPGGAPRLSGLAAWLSTLIDDVQWPPPGVRPLALGLTADGRLTRRAVGEPAPVRYRHDPRHPVPTLGGASAVWGNAGPLDQAPVEARDDVITFTSDAFDGELEVAGSPIARLLVASSSPATDFVVRLTLVRPDGRSFALVDGCWSGRLTDLPAAGSGGPHRQCEVGLAPIHLALPCGARLRLQVTSSSYPDLYPNPNTGHDLALGPPPRVVVAEQSLLIGDGGASLTLPARGAIPSEIQGLVIK